MRLVGCCGCLGKGHQWDGTYALCKQYCPFCNIPLRNTMKRHPAMECPRIPKSRGEILAALAAANLQQQQQMKQA